MSTRHLHNGSAWGTDLGPAAERARAPAATASSGPDRVATALAPGPLESRRPGLLLVDDEQGILEILGQLGRRSGFEVVACANGREALARLRARRFDLALVDVRMPDVDGLDVLRLIRQCDPGCQVLLMTGYATVEAAVEAIKLGAQDFLGKPLDLARLSDLLVSVREESERRRGVLAADGDLARRLVFHGMIGRSPPMQELFHLIRRLAPYARAALITGETGSGKELVARALHALGPRNDRDLVTLDCAAVGESRAEDQLFGRAREGHTAERLASGLLAHAHRATIFLDEIAELPLSAQGRLLRVLERGELHHEDGPGVTHVDVHVLSTTNHDLEADVRAGRFRRDLLYRLNQVELHVPRLGDRHEDIPYLTAAFVKNVAARLGRRLVGLNAAAEQVLSGGCWEGNVRELQHVIERAAVMAEGEFITARELAGLVKSRPGRTPVVEVAVRPPTGDSLAARERAHIIQVLERTGGNKQRAARQLGLSRRALYRRLERHGLAGRTIRGRSNGEAGTAFEPVSIAGPSVASDSRPATVADAIATDGATPGTVPPNRSCRRTVS